MSGATDSSVDISVIVPFHDEERLVGRCVDALVAAVAASPLRGRVEILMVDNASTDGSAREVALRAAHHPMVVLLAEARPGSYAARNRAIAVARGAILAFTDADCTPSPGWLDTIATTFSDPEVMLAIGPRSLAHDRGLLGLVTAWESAKARGLTYGYTNNMAVRRAAMDAVGPFPDVLRGGDTILFGDVKHHFGPSSVRFVDAMHVCHLEVATARDHFQKKLLYGWHAAARSRAAAAQSGGGGPSTRPPRRLLRVVRGLIYDVVVDVPSRASAVAMTIDAAPADRVGLLVIGWADLGAHLVGRALGRLMGPPRKERARRGRG